MQNWNQNVSTASVSLLKLVTCKYEWFKTSDQNFPKLIVDRNYKLTSGRFESHLAPQGRFRTSGFLKFVYKQNQLFLISWISNIKHRDAQPLVSEFNNLARLKSRCKFKTAFMILGWAAWENMLITSTSGGGWRWLSGLASRRGKQLT